MHAITGPHPGVQHGAHQAPRWTPRQPGYRPSLIAWLATVADAGYRTRLLRFIAWYTTLYDTAPELTWLTEHDLITWRQHMVPFARRLTPRPNSAISLHRRACA